MFKIEITYWEVQLKTRIELIVLPHRISPITGLEGGRIVYDDCCPEDSGGLFSKHDHDSFYKRLTKIRKR